MCLSACTLERTPSHTVSFRETMPSLRFACEALAWVLERFPSWMPHSGSEEPEGRGDQPLCLTPDDWIV
jgi:hypothetical protein